MTPQQEGFNLGLVNGANYNNSAIASVILERAAKIAKMLSEVEFEDDIIFHDLGYIAGLSQKIKTYAKV